MLCIQLSEPLDVCVQEFGGGSNEVHLSRCAVNFWCVMIGRGFRLQPHDLGLSVLIHPILHHLIPPA